MASSSPAQPAPAPAPAPVIPSPGPPQAAPAFVDPAILSFNSRPGTGPPTPSPGALPAYASSSAASKSVPQQILAVSQSTPAAAASGSETGGTSRSAKRRQKEKEKRSTQSAGTSAAPELPTPFTASTPEVGGRRGRKERSTESAAASNPSAQSALAPSTAPMRPGGFGEDFDFESGLKGFDKKKIWEEIRVSLSLLVCFTQRVWQGGTTVRMVLVSGITFGLHRTLEVQPLGANTTSKESLAHCVSEVRHYHILID